MHLSKHHGLGNDFLVLLDTSSPVGATVDADGARALCDRRRGVGADGLIVATAGGDGTDVAMVLRNADGSEAEMSGNGIRCLGQALARRHGVDRLDVTVATGAGHRHLRVRPGPDARTALVTVDMGPAKLELAPPWAEVGRAQHRAAVDLGNPHLVLHVEAVGDVDPAREGPPLASLLPGGTNVEWCAPRAGGGLDLVVWERGVGVTEACGTGACAVAAAAQAWGLAGARTAVHMPGGSVDVELGESVILTGPAVHVADVEVPWR